MGLTQSGSTSKWQLAAVFVGANVVSLGAGTPYMYSFYAPQLLERCQIDIAHSSDFSLAISIGMSAMGVFAGMIIDRSPSLASGIGTILTFVAYSTLFFCYSHAYGNVFLIFVALMLAGFGSICAFYAAMKCCTANFPNHRGAAGAFPISQYALSGLVFSYVCSFLFGKNMQSVFLFLTVVCTSTALLGCFTLRIYDQQTTDKDVKQESFLNQTNLASTNETTALLDDNPSSSQNTLGNESMVSTSYTNQETKTAILPSAMSSLRQSLPGSSTSIHRTESASSWSKDLVGSLQYWGIGKARPSDSHIHYLHRNQKQIVTVAQAGSCVDDSPIQRRQLMLDATNRHSILLVTENASEGDIKNSPKQSFIHAENTITESSRLIGKTKTWWHEHPVLVTVTKPRFFAYLLTLATLQGIGQMYIFAVGFVVNTQIQSSNDPTKFNEAELQSLQVSLISVMSFSGRLISGPISDVLVKKFHAQRLWIIAFSAFMSIIASRRLISVDTTATAAEALNNVSFSSVLFGFGFGMTFGTFPAIIADSFGTKGFSTIWGLSTAGGILTVRLLSGVLAKELSSKQDPGHSTCTKGVHCYNHTFTVTQYWGTFAISVSLLTILAGYRTKQLRRRHAVFELEE